VSSWTNTARRDGFPRTGFKKLGIKKVGALVTRGVMIDVAGYKGVDMPSDTYEITVADLEGVLRRQNQALQSGDAVIIHTGWGKLWDKDKPVTRNPIPASGFRPHKG
jgi:kynurenine formamidase